MKNKFRLIRIKKFFKKRIISISVLAGLAILMVNICFLSILYGAISTMINISGEGRVVSESSLTLSLSDYSKIKITPTGYSLSGGSEISYTGPYIITGSRTSDTPLFIFNDTSSGGYNGAVFNIKLVDATIKGKTWCTAIFIQGDCSSVVNIETEGTCQSIGYNHAGIVCQSSNTVLNLNVLSGSLRLASAYSGMTSLAVRGFKSFNFNGKAMTLNSNDEYIAATFNADGTIN